MELAYIFPNEKTRESLHCISSSNFAYLKRLLRHQYWLSSVHCWDFWRECHLFHSTFDPLRSSIFQLQQCLLLEAQYKKFKCFLVRRVCYFFVVDTTKLINLGDLVVCQIMERWRVNFYKRHEIIQSSNTNHKNEFTEVQWMKLDPPLWRGEGTPTHF